MSAVVPGCLGYPTHRAGCIEACAGSPRAPAGVSSGRAGVFVLLVRGFRLMTALIVSLCAVTVWSSIPGYGRRRRRSACLRKASCRMLRGLRIHVEVIGSLCTGASLVVANHQSWLDILVLTATAPMIPVAKADIFSWPMIGGLARRTGAIGVDRRTWRGLPVLVAQMTLALRQGHRVQVFPEATTRCGGAVDQFYRAAFQAALDAAVVVQPAALSYFDHLGHPTRLAAFVGDTELIDSLRKVLRAPALRVRLQWIPAVPAIAGTGLAATDRRSVTELAQGLVARALGQEVVYRQAAQRPRKITSAESIWKPGATIATSAESATGRTEA